LPTSPNSTPTTTTPSLHHAIPTYDASPNIIYTITSGPSHGTIELNGIAATTFTQADIDAGLVTYTHDGSENFADSFSFAVSDDGAAGGSTGTFTIARRSAVESKHDALLTLRDGSVATVTSALVQTTDKDHAPPTRDYTTTSGPTHGTIELNGIAATTFTQADIDAGLVTYTHDGSENFSDSFSFAVSDDGAAGGSTGTFT